MSHTFREKILALYSDLRVADGDGVIVVPQEVAEAVARIAHEEHARDKQTRRAAYRRLGKAEDSTVK